MKNIINFYYGFNICNIHQNNEDYFFDNLNKSYILKKYDKSIELLNNYLIINNTNSFYHKIILTKDNLPYVNISNKIYVLLELSNLIDDKISIYDLNSFIISSNNYLDWYKLWCERIDYFEYEIEHNKNKDLLLLPIYNFMIGISENAISYYKNTIDKFLYNNKYYIAHHRIDINMNLIEFYNPLETVIDIRVRDIGEYIKSLIINNNLDILLIDEYLSYIKLDDYEASLLLSRILFPSNLFDNLKNREYLLRFDIDKYIYKLKEVYKLLKNKYNIEEVFWLK